MIKKIDHFSPENTHVVYIIGENTNTAQLDSNIQEFVVQFTEGKKDFDYLKLPKHHLFLVKENSDKEKMRIAGSSIRTNLDKSAETLAIVGSAAHSLLVAEGLALANYQFLKYFKDADSKKNALHSIYVQAEVSESELLKLNNVLKSVLWARDMVNEPVSFLTATQLAAEIQTLGKEAGFSVDVFEKSKIEALKMGGLLAVNKGSIEPPTFTVMEYKPENPVNSKPIVLVGKGVVYDTGGLSLKPTAGSMDSMKSDMAGAATMVGAVYAAALNKQNVHLIGLIPSTDNRPGENAYTPGDVIEMYDGTTVEVLNTDAEGRMILADAIAYANKFDPELIIDAATLTGAAVMAIGQKASCIMGNADSKIMQDIVASGYDVHERVVELPFWDEYFEDMKSSIADLKNIGSRYAGMITAGKFLEHFAKAPYIHIDIAGPSFLEAPQDYKGKGGTGVGIRLLNNYFEKIV